MNKAELIDAVSIEAGQSKAEATRSINALIKIIKDTLAQKDELAHVHISGLGNFSRKSRAARTGRNPKTGEAVDIPAKVVPGFMASKALKEAVS
jgi:DNA-binding protein HU-beta